HLVRKAEAVCADSVIAGYFRRLKRSLGQEDMEDSLKLVQTDPSLQPSGRSKYCFFRFQADHFSATAQLINTSINTRIKAWKAVLNIKKVALNIPRIYCKGLLRIR